MSAAATNSLDLVRDARRASALLHPMRLRIMEALTEPDSAAGLARRFGIPRQRVNYHVRELSRAGFLMRAGRHRRRNMVEQRYMAAARSYVLSPELLGSLGAEAHQVPDTLSATYLLALTTQAQGELARGVRESTAQGKRLATMSLASELRFESAEQRAAFARALESAVVDVVGRFSSPAKRDDGGVVAGRLYRMIVGCYPIPPAAESAAGVKSISRLESRS